ncbi:hypothetical protein IY145_11090 [Methylosinus sp. H3A]|uniref:hypothetical protein n=1 Tax=Methylosinus sp. H3A TaxID=2785786 RepID=UPI0018C2E06C|nr:hypothetical protein [Methylosinus sp. H3A]MBG0809924.1 hypothetical protein [Methylosinus sp. H3A]
MKEIAFHRRLANNVAHPASFDGERDRAGYGGQDKRDSLRLCPAVVLSFFVSTFVQPVNSWRSLSIFACDSNSTAIFTSSALRHVS